MKTFCFSFIILLFFSTLMISQTPGNPANPTASSPTASSPSTPSVQPNSTSPIIPTTTNPTASTTTPAASSLLGDTVVTSLSFGANFDFLNGLKATDLYADFRFEAPRIFSDRFALEAGIYQQRTITLLDTAKQEQFRLINSQKIDDTLRLSYITWNSKSRQETTVENLGFYVQPKLIIAGNLTTKSKLYSVLHVELIRSINVSLLKREITGRDTSATVPREWPRPYGTVNTVLIEDKIKNTNFNYYAGFGLEFNHKERYADFKLKVIPGYLFSKEKVEEKHGIIDHHSHSFFYVVQLEAMEKVHSGVKLGAEVRGNGFYQGTPWISVYLAKRFPLTKLGELLKP